MRGLREVFVESNVIESVAHTEHGVIELTTNILYKYELAEICFSKTSSHNSLVLQIFLHALFKKNILS